MVFQTSGDISRADDPFYQKFLAVSVGNIMEWYDFAVFGCFADVIAEQYFPVASNSNLSLLKSFAVFGAAFYARPLGGLLFGYIGDVLGRKRALELSMLIMLLSSLFIGCIPNYKQIGMPAIILLILMRLCQGIAAGGELMGAFIFTVESTELGSDNNGGYGKCFWSALIKSTGNFGVTLGVGIASLLRSSFSEDQLSTYGWRIPFALGGLIGAVGLYLRHQLVAAESPREVGNRTLSSLKCDYPNSTVPTETTTTSTSDVEGGADEAIYSVETVLLPPDHESAQPSFVQSFRRHRPQIVVLIFVASVWGCGYYSILTWLTYYLTSPDLIGGPAFPNAWFLMFLMNLLIVILLPVWGLLADAATAAMPTDVTCNRNPARPSVGLGADPLDGVQVELGIVYLLRLGTLILVCSPLPCFILISTKEFVNVTVAVFVMTVGVSMFGAALPSYLVCSVRDRSVRYSVLGVAYNLSSLVFAGTAPVVQTALVMQMHGDNEQRGTVLPSGLYSGAYITVIALLSLLFQLYNEGWFRTRMCSK